MQEITRNSKMYYLICEIERTVTGAKERGVPVSIDT